MMKTSVFALDQRDSGPGEGRRREGTGSAHRRHLLSLVQKRVHPEHNVGCPSPWERGRATGVGGSLPPQSLWTEDGPDFALGLVQFPIVSGTHDKELRPWELLWDRGGERSSK